MAFDWLYARGKDLRKRPLRVRRNGLEEIVESQQLVLPARRLADNGLEAWGQVLERGYEGLVGKDEAHPTEKAGRSPGSRSRSGTTARASADWSRRARI
jgi:ATP-dependent DNA ligase